MTFVRVILAECGGKSVIDDLLNGTIMLSTDSDKYSPNTHCEWLIKGKSPLKLITVFV